MNVVIYTRFSSHKQSEQSTIGQLNACREFAEKHEYNIIGEYTDEATTGTNDNRPQFKQMIEDSAKGNFQGIIVYQLDRFARNRYDSAINKAKLKKNGVRVLSARENITDDASGILMESVLEGMAEYFSVELGQKTKRGMILNAEKCYYNGSSIPLGLKLVEAERITRTNNKPIIKYRFDIDEETAKVVRNVFNMYIEGETMLTIAEYLQKQQIKTTRGNEYDKKSVQRLLKDKKYIGIYENCGIVVNGGIPSIIDDDTFAKVREMLDRNKKNPSRTRAKAEYILTTKLFCGHCKEMMVGHSGTSSSKAIHNYYKCNGVIKKSCDKKTVQKKFIEDLVIDEARKILTDENIMIIAKSVVEVAEKELDTSNLKRLNKILREHEKKKNNLFESLKICDIDSVKKSIFEEIGKMDKEQQDIEKQIIEEEACYVKLTVPQVKFFLTQLKKGDINDEKYRRMLITVLVNKIYLYDDKINIVFNSQGKAVTIDTNLEKELEVGLSRQEGHHIIIKTLLKKGFII